MRDLVSRKLGPYEIREVIGQGGMATVYRAYQPSLNRFVAIKVLNVVTAQDAESVARFRQEALAAGGLDHPNILRIYDAGSFEGRQYIVMAYAPGGSLAQRLRKEEALRDDEAADIVAQIAGALHYAHRHDVVHRDVKPSNILLDEEGRPLLADFGIARAVNSSARLTQTGASIGTPDYMSPEQAEGGRVDGRSDLFSLGIVLYQMVAGKLPFQADTSMATMFQVVHQTPPTPRSVNPAIPLYLDSIIQKALAKLPDSRFSTGLEMAQALRERRVVAIPPPPEPWDQATQAMRALPARQPAQASRGTKGESSVARFAGRGFLIGLLVLALMVLFGAGGYLTWDGLHARGEQVLAPTAAILAAQALPVETPTPSPSEAPSPSPTLRAGGVIVAATTPPTAMPTPTETPVSTQSPVVVVITVMAPAPTVAPIESATPLPTPTASPSPTAPAATAKLTTTSQAAPVTPGMVLDFENFGGWRIGDEPYGSFKASAEQKHGGQTAGKLTYQFPATPKNYVVFTRVPAAAIPGQPLSLKLWVYGDGSGHFLNAWVRDSQNEVRQFTFGQITHTGWQELTASLDTTAAWPQQHISGTDNGRLDFPIRLDALVLDGVPDGGGPFAGVIYVDDLSVSDVAAPTVSAPAAVATASPVMAAAPAAGDSPARLTGHIVYTRGAGGATSVSVLDVANRSTWELRGSARQPDIAGNGRVVLNGIGGGKDSIYSIDLDGSREQMNSVHSEDNYPSWSPTGVSSVIYSQLQGDGKDRIYILLDMSTTQEPTKLQINGADVFGKYPIWLETWRIAFTGCNYWGSGSNCGIWTLNSNGSGAPTQLTTDPSDISTDSARGTLLFASPKTGNWEVYAMPNMGGPPQNLTNSPSQDTGATFSPDGRYIALMSDRGGGWGIWVMNADGSNPQELVAVPGFGAGWTEERLAWGP